MYDINRLFCRVHSQYADIETTDTYKKGNVLLPPYSHPADLILFHAASNTSFARIT
jgi:hypothetical protein